VGVGVSVLVGEGEGVAVGESVAVGVADWRGKAVAAGEGEAVARVSAVTSAGEEVDVGGGAGALHPAKSRKNGRVIAKISRINADPGFLCSIDCITFW